MEVEVEVVDIRGFTRGGEVGVVDIRGFTVGIYCYYILVTRINNKIPIKC